MQGNGSREEHTRADRAGCKRGCSLYLHGWALHMSTAVCPVLFWNISLHLHNLALSHAHMCCKENVAIPHGVAEVDLMLAAGVRLSVRTSLPCAVSCWSQGSPCSSWSRERGSQPPGKCGKSIWGLQKQLLGVLACVYLPQMGMLVPACVSPGYVLSYYCREACKWESGNCAPQSGQRRSTDDDSSMGSARQQGPVRFGVLSGHCVPGPVPAAGFPHLQQCRPQL